VRPSANSNVVMTIGEYVEGLLSQQDYFQTRFPRIPIVADNEIKSNILLMKEFRERRKANLEKLEKFVRGTLVKVFSKQVSREEEEKERERTMPGTLQ